MDSRRRRASDKAPRQGQGGGPARSPNIPANFPPPLMTDNLDYTGMGSGIDPNAAYDIERSSKDDFLASLNDASSSSTAIPEQMHNDTFESTSPNPGFSYDHTYAGQDFFGLMGSEQKYEDIFAKGNVVDRLVMGNASSCNGEASSSDTGHPNRLSFSLTAPHTSVSSQDNAFTRSMAGDIPFYHSFGSEGAHSHYMGPAATLSSHSGARSEVFSEQEEDLVTNTQVTAGFQDQRNPFSIPAYVRDRQSNQAQHSQQFGQTNSQAYIYQSMNNAVPGDGGGGGSGLTVATGWNQQYRPDANNFSPSSNVLGTNETWGYHGTNTQDSSPSGISAGPSRSTPFSPIYDTISMANNGDRSPRYLVVPSSHRHRRQSDPPPPSYSSSRSRQSMMRSSSQRVVNFQGSMSPTGTAPFYSREHALERFREGIPRKAARGKRSRKMSSQEKLNARLKRENRSTCIYCKYSRTKCVIPEGQDSCKKCSMPGRRSKCPKACVRADFIEHVEKGPLDFVAMHSINHEMVDGSGRRRLPMPGVISCQELRRDMRTAKQQSWEFIRVSLGPDTLYDLDLAACDEYLSVISSDLREEDVRKVLVDDMRKNGGEWRNLAHFSDPSKDGIENLIRCSEMLGRQTFTLMSTSRVSMMLDPDNPSHRGMFHVAAIFSRIFSRGIELQELKDLQKRLTDYTDITPELTVALGRFLFLLRWKLSWWQFKGSGLPADCEGILERPEYTDRVTKICKTLYFYFICILAKEGSRLESFLPFDQWPSLYVDMPSNEPIYEEFPTADSLQGFYQWMQEGRAKLEESGVQDRVIPQQGQFYGIN